MDTGLWRNIGQRLVAVRDQVAGEEMFLANYSDGLTDAPLQDMIEFFEKDRQDRLFHGRPGAV